MPRPAPLTLLAAICSALALLLVPASPAKSCTPHARCAHPHLYAAPAASPPHRDVPVEVWFVPLAVLASAALLAVAGERLGRA